MYNEHIRDHALIGAVAWVHKVRSIKQRHITVRGGDATCAVYICAKTSSTRSATAIHRNRHASLRGQVNKRLGSSAWLLCLRCKAFACSPIATHVHACFLGRASTGLSDFLARCPTAFSLRCQAQMSQTATLLNCSPKVRGRPTAEALTALRAH